MKKILVDTSHCIKSPIYEMFGGQSVFTKEYL